MPGTASQKLATLRAQIGGVLRGKADIVDQVLVAALAGGHVLLEDVPGDVAYASIDDRDGEARALTAAADVERLEFLLSTEQHKERGDAVSRQHLAVSRDGGAFYVRDLGSRNGTQLRGLPVRGSLPVGEGIELRLGREVPVTVTPSRLLEGAVDLEVPGQKVTSAFGPVRLSVSGGAWVLQEAADGLIELRVTSPNACAYLGDVALGDGATLLVGDALSTERAGPPVLKVLG